MHGVLATDVHEVIMAASYEHVYKCTNGNYKFCICIMVGTQKLQYTALHKWTHVDSSHYRNSLGIASEINSVQYGSKSIREK